jgi:sigma-B regulation protein RsbU (phosphoserine phosphatase)
MTAAEPALADVPAEQLYDDAPCGYLSTSPSGTIIRANRTFLRMTGYAQEELVGRRTFAQLLTGGGRLYHETHYAPMLLMQGRVREIAVDILCADGRRLPVLVNAELVRDVSGTPVVVRVALFDATERRAYERELVLARRRAEASEAHARELVGTLQQVLVPPAPPTIDGLDVAGVYRPARQGEEVGGDFYDVFQTGADQWTVVIGDVCGKGIGAAVVTALLRHSIRASVAAEATLADALRAVNRTVLDHATDRSSTVALVRLDRAVPGWAAVVCCAGHPLPLLLSGGQARQVGAPGTLIGILPEPTFQEVRLDLVPGDQLVLFTDGVTEGRRGAEFYDLDRLLTNASRPAPSAQALARRLVEDAVEFQGGSTRDDMAVVVATVSAPSRTR